MTTTYAVRSLAAAALLLGAASAHAADVPAPVCTPSGGVTFADPVGDDNGPGTYVYPTDAVYKPGSFDITEFQVVPSGDQVEFRVTVNSRIEDPWDSQAWGGNGFSIQMAFIHIATDAGRATGVKDGLAGLNVRFAEPWDKVVILSPQGATRLNSEIDSKAAQFKSRIIVPKITRASGRTLIGVVDVAQLGGTPTKTWGYQVLMQSNEGFPDKTDLLTRKINEFEGQHRFGGGTDYDNDPHVLDILVPQGGDPVAKQHEILSKYNKNATTDVKPEDLAVLPMVYPCVEVAAGVVATSAGAPVGEVAAAPAAGSPAAAAPAPRPSGGGGLNFDMNGKIYTKYMYQNDNTQGCLSMSNPFWVDNIGGHNGACTEFEMNIRARVSDKVSAGVRLQSRWGAMWQDWWENGDLKVGVADTSGESLGMNHAAYIKLRSAFARVAAPIPTVSWVTIGSTDFSMWNEWTIGKARYIDRDNGNGVFVEGAFGPDKMIKYTTGAMALPKLWAGPGWQTGLPGNNGAGGDALAKLYGTDWAFAAKLESRVTDDLRFKLIGTLLKDWEADRNSPFLTGAPDAARGADHSVALATRFRGANATLDGAWTPSAHEWLSVSGLLAASSNYVNPDYATNLVRQGQGFSPVVYKTDAKGNPIDSNGLAGTLLVELFDPLKTGLSVKLQYFNIGSEYNAVMGSRREADVLITDGIIAGGFTRGGQLPTLNIANEFQDWDEPWYESCIGWHGATLLFEYVKGSLKATGEYTFIGRNTNMQNRDIQNQYPDFLHYTHGFTDTTAYTADSDYANSYGRGADPRSVYSQYADRRTHVAVLNVQYLLPKSAVLTVKGKFIDDFDGRKDGTTSDDYQGREYLGMFMLTFQPTNEMKANLGYEISYWTEQGRDGTEEAGYHNGDTRRHTVHGGFNYAFGGALLSYQLEYFHKDRYADRTAYYDMKWNVWRSKATFEVAW